MQKYKRSLFRVCWIFCVCKLPTKKPIKENHLTSVSNRKEKNWVMFATVCIRDLDLRNEMIILSHFWLLLKWASFFEAAGAVAKIGSSLKPNHHTLVEIRETHCIKDLDGTLVKVARWLFMCQFWTLSTWATIFGANQWSEIVLSLIPNNQSYDKLVQIPDANGRSNLFSLASVATLFNSGVNHIRNSLVLKRN